MRKGGIEIEWVILFVIFVIAVAVIGGIIISANGDIGSAKTAVDGQIGKVGEVFRSSS